MLESNPLLGELASCVGPEGSVRSTMPSMTSRLVSSVISGCRESTFGGGDGGRVPEFFFFFSHLSFLEKVAAEDESDCGPGIGRNET